MITTSYLSIFKLSIRVGWLLNEVEETKYKFSLQTDKDGGWWVVCLRILWSEASDPRLQRRSETFSGETSDEQSWQSAGNMNTTWRLADRRGEMIRWVFPLTWVSLIRMRLSRMRWIMIRYIGQVFFSRILWRHRRLHPPRYIILNDKCLLAQHSDKRGQYWLKC